MPEALQNPSRTFRGPEIPQTPYDFAILIPPTASPLVNCPSSFFKGKLQRRPKPRARSLPEASQKPSRTLPRSQKIPQAPYDFAILISPTASSWSLHTPPYCPVRCEGLTDRPQLVPSWAGDSGYLNTSALGRVIFTISDLIRVRRRPPTGRRPSPTLKHP